MAIAYLLDTNTVSVLIDRLDDPTNRVSIMIARCGVERVAINVIIAGEIWAGVDKRRSLRLREQASAVVSSLPVLAIEQPVETVYGSVRANLERRGTPIGSNDLWIAAHALVLDVTLVTANTSEFARVDGLRVENWLA